MVRSDSGAKYDQSRINRIMALVIDLSNQDLSILIDRLQQEKSRRVSGDNIETIQV